MNDDASGQSAFDVALSGGDPVPSPQPDPGPQEVPQAQPQGEGGPSQPEQPPQAGISPVPRVPQQERQDGGIPAWRLREEAEARRVAEARAADFERRWSEHQEQQRRQAAEKDLAGQDFYGSDPGQFIDGRLQHQLERFLGPIQQRFDAFGQQMQQQVRDQSHAFATQQHGADKVQAAYERSVRALQAGDPTAVQLERALRDPGVRDPWKLVMDWDRRFSVYEATGGDLDKYRQSYADELLKDPVFLARAQEAHRSQAQPVQTGLPGRAPPAPNRGLPSLNRASTAQADGEEEMDPQAVFDTALATPRR